jgi:Eco57I restriction-modification methylase
MSQLHDRMPNPRFLPSHPYQIVKTPETLVEKILDGLPKEVWSKPELKWFNPCSKTGVFELSAYKRLMIGLRDVIADPNARRDHIIGTMLHSFCPTKATYWLTQRFLLGSIYGKRGNLDYSGIRNNVHQIEFLDEEAVVVEGKEVVMKKENKSVSFTGGVIVGNPPYQSSDGGGGQGSSAGPIYPDFVLKAMKLNPAYLSMVIPARWMNGSGKGIQDFLEKMIACPRLSKIVSTENEKEWFPDIDLTGGAMFFLMDETKTGSVVEINGSQLDLDGEQYIPTNRIDLTIKDKVCKYPVAFDRIMLLRKPYGLLSSSKDWEAGVEVDEGIDTLVCHINGNGGGGSATKFVDRAKIVKNANTVLKWKVCLPKAYGATPRSTGHPFVIPPNHIVSESYLVMACLDSETEARNAEAYFNTHFAQFMVAIRKTTQNMSGKTFKWLPFLDFTRSYTDADLYAMFGLTTQEVAHIETTTKDFPMFRAKRVSSGKRKKTI